MKTYKIVQDWHAVRQFAIDNLSPFSKDVGFMYRDTEVIVRSYNDQALKILKNNFDLIACEQPGNVLDADSGWGYFGNDKVFDFKI